ncbi:hypothetical protein RZ517_00325 [Roseovarius sp. S88]|uniref:Secreted protein n=2 Tax=Roseovarius phycicola TaxID=3080976 RepID=A0ABZ2HHA8_9RHOB
MTRFFAAPWFQCWDRQIWRLASMLPNFCLFSLSCSRLGINRLSISGKLMVLVVLDCINFGTEVGRSSSSIPDVVTRSHRATKNAQKTVNNPSFARCFLPIVEPELVPSLALGV